MPRESTISGKSKVFSNRAGGSKKVYRKPRVTFREPLEALAVACVPSPPGKPDIVQCANPQT